MALSKLLQALEEDLAAARAEGIAAALQAIRDYRAPLQDADEVGDEDGYDASYLEGLDDAIVTLEQLAASESTQVDDDTDEA